MASHGADGMRKSRRTLCCDRELGRSDAGSGGNYG
jgi:hypothetical protein